MSNPNANPLVKHFRQPAIYLKLPSKGQYYPDGALDLPVTGEIPVYPMTVKDELVLKTPDALMNGSSMSEVIISCCPSIKDPWSIPSIDLDAIFIAIRLASYGTGMDITSKCPHCDAQNENTINLTNLLENIRSSEYSQIKLVDDLQFEFKPQTFKNINEANIYTFEQRQLINNTLASDLPEDEKQKNFKQSFDRLASLNTTMLVNSIKSVTTKEGVVVSDPTLIHEFLTNTDAKTFGDLRQYVENMLQQSKTQDAKINCGECNKEYTTALVFDQSNFFV